ncbi:hypothetical protein NL676_020455 [Syzygium grande]|nr:hypothetical protein NL676_020455 [Syzygium grande]
MHSISEYMISDVQIFRRLHLPHRSALHFLPSLHKLWLVLRSSSAAERVDGRQTRRGGGGFGQVLRRKEGIKAKRNELGRRGSESRHGRGLR